MGSVAKAISLDAAVATSFLFFISTGGDFHIKRRAGPPTVQLWHQIKPFFKKNELKKKMLKETMLFANTPESLDRATGKQKHRGSKHDARLLASLQLFFFSPAHLQVMKS